MTPPRVDIDKPMRLLIVRHLLAGALTLPEVAHRVGLSYQQVLDVANVHGYPDEGRMTKAAEMLQDGLENTVPPPVAPTPSPPRRKEHPMSEPTQEQDELTLSDIIVIIGEGKRSSSKRTVTLADRVAKDAEDLLERVTAERVEAKNAARIAELQAEIDRLRGVSARKWVTCKVVNCGQPVANLQGLNLHRTRSHGLPNLTQAEFEKEQAS